MLKPTVGPILGHTTSRHARIFLRGGPDKHSPVFAGIRYRRTGDSTWSTGRFAALHPSRDMTAVIVLDGLAADTRYDYQAGWFTTMSPVHTVETVRELPLQWPRETYHLHTASGKNSTPSRYIVGSCRYLRMTLGVPSAPAKGDRIFAAIQDLVAKASPPFNALLMTGDQVYVDDLNIIAPDRSYQDILHKYRTAFSQPHIQELMSQLPTYMILDDHEIEDNWPANESASDKHLFTHAMKAYELYQASHGPGPVLQTNGQLTNTLERYWYPFGEGDIQWFVTDSRTRRNLSADDRRILDVAQEQALLTWLIHSPARVKFVVTSVMFYPDRKTHGDDAWKAFPEQRLRLLETIRSHRIKNVIFVSGDVHGSLTSRLTHSEDPGFEVHTIVSSPLCNSALLPYAKASTFILDQPLARVATGEYRHVLTSPVISEDNFAQLEIDADQLNVTFHNRDGKALQTVAITLR
ncbi:alkaline phosphatase D family protein [Pseudomonas purpurea]|uniref:alkaline phosphatase D family protein n=1 Tax=Pseudomonas purpurea TaxID=3136737 RepID=UPI003266F5FC